MMLGLLVFVVGSVLGVPIWVALAAGLVVAAAVRLTIGPRRRARERRAAELAAQRAVRKVERRAERNAAIRERTGLDVELVSRATQDAVHAVGSRITRRLEKRYADPEPAGRDDWLDLDNDVDALRSRATTAEALRLSDELARARRTPDTR